MIYLGLKHKEMCERTIIILAAATQRLASYQWWQHTLLTIGAHLTKHIFIVLVLVIRNLGQPYLIAAVLIFVFF